MMPPRKGGLDYLFITYIVTSKPKRISVATGVVHILESFIVSLRIQFIRELGKSDLRYAS
jgi:hypothetical protein